MLDGKKNPVGKRQREPTVGRKLQFTLGSGQGRPWRKGDLWTKLWSAGGVPCSRPHQQGQLSSHSCLQEEKRKVACFAELGRTAQTQQSRDRSRELQSPEPVSTCCPVAGLLTRRLTPVCLTPYRTASPASFPTAPLTESQLLFPVSVREAELPSGRAVGKENTKIWQLQINGCKGTEDKKE